MIKIPNKDIQPIKLLNAVPHYIDQSGIAVAGCELISAVIMLNMLGYKITVQQFLSKLEQKDWSNDQRADPTAAFVGNPKISSGVNCGYGCYSPCIAAGIKELGIDAKVIKDPLSDLTKYIDDGIPVLIWATMNMKPSQKGDSWTINYVNKDSSLKVGDQFTWIAGEHCLVMVGYSDEFYIFADPYKNNGICAFEKKLVEKRYIELGSQAVVVQK